jgi:hypothetical protein
MLEIVSKLEKKRVRPLPLGPGPHGTLYAYKCISVARTLAGLWWREHPRRQLRRAPNAESLLPYHRHHYAFINHVLLVNTGSSSQPEAVWIDERHPNRRPLKIHILNFKLVLLFVNSPDRQGVHGFLCFVLVLMIKT